MKKAIYLVLAGVAVGMLVAPRSGSATLEKLKKGFKDWKDDAKDQLNEVISKGKAMANTLND